MYILGISAYYHDLAACLLKDGIVVAAAQEERFTRKKHDQNFPHNAIKYCLKEANISSSDLEIIAFYDKPFLKFERILETYLSYAPKGISCFVVRTKVDYEYFKKNICEPNKSYMQSINEESIIGLIRKNKLL